MHPFLPRLIGHVVALTCTASVIPLADSSKNIKSMKVIMHFLVIIKNGYISTFFQGSASSGSLLVSDQPYTAEDGFLPVSVSREGEATISHHTDELHSHENLWESADVVKNDDDEEQVHTAEEEEEEEQLEEDEESGVILGAMTEPDLDDFGFRVLVEEKEEAEVEDSKQLEEDGSGNTVQERFSESEEEEGSEGEDDISDVQQASHLNQKEGVLRHWMQLERMLPSEVRIQGELQPVSEGEQENRKHTGRGEEDDRMITSEVEWKNDDSLPVDDREMTWYFTWR